MPNVTHHIYTYSCVNFQNNPQFRQRTYIVPGQRMGQAKKRSMPMSKKKKTAFFSAPSELYYFSNIQYKMLSYFKVTALNLTILTPVTAVMKLRSTAMLENT
jgi:hypothetical protein